MSWIIGIGIAVAIIALASWSARVSEKQRQLRRASLIQKYGNESIADRIMAKRFWVDMTQEQLLDSLGRPLDIDQKVLKTKTKEIWKYSQTGTNRYALRITLENKIVIGWDDKR
jgi:hypothetical protein